MSFLLTAGAGECKYRWGEKEAFPENRKNGALFTKMAMIYLLTAALMGAPLSFMKNARF